MNCPYCGRPIQHGEGGCLDYHQRRIDERMRQRLPEEWGTARQQQWRQFNRNRRRSSGFLTRRGARGQ